MTVRPLALVCVAVAVSLLASAPAEAQRRRRRRAGPGTLVLRTDVEGAEVIIDEEPVGYTPLDPQTLPAGQHTVRVRRPGFTEFDDVVTIESNRDTELDVPLIALAMIVTVRSSPDEARVFVDGSFRGTAPIELELTDGEHEIRATLPRYQEVVRTINARPGQTELVELTLEPIPEELLNPPDPEWYEEPLTWVLVGAGALVVAAAIVLVAIFATQSNAVDSFCPMPGDCLELPAITSPTWRFDM